MGYVIRVDGNLWFRLVHGFGTLTTDHTRATPLFPISLANEIAHGHFRDRPYEIVDQATQRVITRYHPAHTTPRSYVGNEFIFSSDHPHYAIHD